MFSSILDDDSIKKPPTFCAHDFHSGSYKLCCKKAEAPTRKPDPILRYVLHVKDLHLDLLNTYPYSISFSNYSCLDLHSHCPRILELNPTACDYTKENLYYDFMMVACQKTCNICGDDVNSRLNQFHIPQNTLNSFSIRDA